MKKTKTHNQKGSSLLVIFIILIVAVAVGAGAYAWHHHSQGTKSGSSSSAPKTSTHSQTNSNAAIVSPQNFVSLVLGAVASNNETQLEPYLSQSFRTFRRTNLSEAPCNGSTTNINFSTPKVLALFCSSLLNPADLTSLTPAVSNFISKAGQQGKSVDYKIVQAIGDAGTTYYTFKLLPNGNSWQLYDYGDMFVDTSAAVPNPLLGEFEMSQ